MNKDLLGRKIIDLIEENKLDITDNEEIHDIELSKIKPNPNQPRVNFDSQALKQLAESIKQHGVIQPVILKPSHDGYILVAGERRVRASSLAGKTTIPAIIRDYNAIYLTELSILENLQREDLTPIEEAVAYEKAIKNLGLTQAELGQKIGKSRSYITNVIGLLNLPLVVIDNVNSGYISMGHAKILSKLEDKTLVHSLAEKIKNDQISVRKLEELVKRRNDKTKVTKSKNEKSNAISKEISNTLSSVFGDTSRVMVNEKEIRIKYKNIEDIENIINKYFK